MEQSGLKVKYVQRAKSLPRLRLKVECLVSIAD